MGFLLFFQDAIPKATQAIETVAQVSEKPWIESGNVVAGIIGGLVAVLVTLVSEFIIRKYEKAQEKSEQQIVRFKNETRKITGSIFRYLGPDANVEMMKSDLGPPNKQYFTGVGWFTPTEGEKPYFPEEINYEKEAKRYTGFLYRFENADVKIVSEDGQSIIALTVLATDYDNPSITMPDSDTEYLNKYKVDKSLFEVTGARAEHQPGCRDVVTAVSSTSYVPELATTTTYFLDGETDFHSCDLDNHPELTIGATVYGVCLSKGIENVSYIYISELY